MKRYRKLSYINPIGLATGGRRKKRRTKRRKTIGRRQRKR